LSLRGAAEAISAEVAASRTPRNDSSAPPGSHSLLPLRLRQHRHHPLLCACLCLRL